MVFGVVGRMGVWGGGWGGGGGGGGRGGGCIFKAFLKR